MTWSTCEKLATAAASRGVELLNIPRVGARFVKGNLIRQKTACDIVGTIRGSGRLFVADVKCCESATSLNLNDDHLKPHQRDELIAQGQAGAVAGIIAFATHRDIDLVFWADWTLLGHHVHSIKWTDIGLIQLGSGGVMPDLRPIVRRKVAA